MCRECLLSGLTSCCLAITPSCLVNISNMCSPPSKIHAPKTRIDITLTPSRQPSSWLHPSKTSRCHVRPRVAPPGPRRRTSPTGGLAATKSGVEPKQTEGQTEVASRIQGEVLQDFKDVDILDHFLSTFETPVLSTSCPFYIFLSRIGVISL